MKSASTIAVYGLAAWLNFTHHAADINGQWRTEFDTQIGVQKCSFTFQAEGDKLTIKANSEMDGWKREAELK